MTAVNFRNGAVTIIPPYVASTVQSSPFTTNSYEITQLSKFALQLIITNASSLNVSVKVQISLDNINWVDYPSTSVVFTANGTYVWDNMVTSAIWVRLNFSTFTAGSANFQVLAMAKL